MRREISSAGIARPASGGRGSGSVPATTARRSVSPPRSTPPKRPARRGSDMQPLAIFFLVAVAIGGVAWVFLYPTLSGERKVEKRKETVVRTGSAAPARTARNQQKSRREQVEGTLKELEQRSSKSVPLQVKIQQAGLSWSKQRFYITGAMLAVGGAVAGLMLDAGPLGALA